MSQRIENSVNTIVVGEDILENDPHVQKLKDKIIEDYTGSVLGTKFGPILLLGTPMGRQKLTSSRG